MTKRPLRGGIILSTAFLALFALISVAPFLWMLISATNTSADITKGALWFGDALFQNLQALFTKVDLLTAFRNSLLIAGIGTVFSLLITSMAGYGFEMHHTRPRELLFSILLLSMMIPFAAIMIPLYRQFAGWQLLDSPIAVILPNLSTAFLLFFFRQNAKSFPHELLQAARVDGLGEMAIYFRIYLPTMHSVHAAAAIITFMNYWNAYLWPLVVLHSNESRTVPLMLSSLSASYTPDFGIEMCALILATLPTAILFFLMQRRFVEGILGAVK